MDTPGLSIRELDALFDQSPVAMVFRDRELRARRTNAAFRQLTGISDEAIIGRRPSETRMAGRVMDMDLVERMLAGQVMSAGVPVVGMRLEQALAGTRRVFAWSARPTATSRCSRVGRPGPGVSRNRPCSRPPASASSSVSCPGGSPASSASHVCPALVTTRPSRSSRGGLPIPAAPSWNRQADSPSSRVRPAQTWSMSCCGSEPVARSAPAARPAQRLSRPCPG